MVLQNTVNQLLEQYVLHLIRTDQHTLIPLYACHMRQGARRSTYAAYLHGMTKRSMTECQEVHQLAQHGFEQFPRGDIQGATEMADIVEKVSCLSLPLMVLLGLVHRSNIMDATLMCTHQAHASLVKGRWSL